MSYRTYKEKWYTGLWAILVFILVVGGLGVVFACFLGGY